MIKKGEINIKGVVFTDSATFKNLSAIGSANGARVAPEELFYIFEKTQDDLENTIKYFKNLVGKDFKLSSVGSKVALQAAYGVYIACVKEGLFKKIPEELKRQANIMGSNNVDAVLQDINQKLSVLSAERAADKKTKQIFFR